MDHLSLNVARPSIASDHCNERCEEQQVLANSAINDHNHGAQASAAAFDGPYVGILGPYGTGNLGDAAIQDALVYQIRQQAPEICFCGISLNPQDTKTRHGIAAFPIDARAASSRLPRIARWALRGRSRFPILRAVQWCLAPLVRLTVEMAFTISVWAFAKRLQLLIVSGGGQIDDYWGGPSEHPFSLFRWTVVARMRGCKVLFLSVGGWELRSRLSRVLMRISLRLADYRSYRDETTREFVESIGVRPPHHVFPDLAFGYPVPADGQRAGRAATRLVIGLCPIAAETFSTADDPQYARYLDRLAEFASSAVERGHEIRLFASQVKMDSPVAAALTDRVKKSLSEVESQRVRYLAVESVQDFVSAAREVDVVVASRLHGVLLALVATTPVIAVSYHRKVDVLMEQFDLTPFCVKLQQLGDGALSTCFNELVPNRADLIERIQGHLAACRRALQQQLETVLPHVVHVSRQPARTNFI
jgi:polysaccharide pyruvyl transferase WcaK-like protein